MTTPLDVPNHDRPVKKGAVHICENSKCKIWSQNPSGQQNKLLFSRPWTHHICFAAAEKIRLHSQGKFKSVFCLEMSGERGVWGRGWLVETRRVETSQPLPQTPLEPLISRQNTDLNLQRRCAGLFLSAKAKLCGVSTA